MEAGLHEDAAVELEAMGHIYPPSAAGGDGEGEMANVWGGVMFRVVTPTTAQLVVSPALPAHMPSLWLVLSVPADDASATGGAGSAGSDRPGGSVHPGMPSQPPASMLLQRNSSLGGDDGAKPTGYTPPRPRIVQLRKLLPVTATVVLPPEYPARAPPDVSLSAPWLSTAAALAVRTELHRQWREDAGCGVVLYTWAGWLESELVPFLLHTAATAGAGVPVWQDVELAASVVRWVPPLTSHFSLGYRREPDAIMLMEAPGTSGHTLPRHRCLCIGGKGWIPTGGGDGCGGEGGAGDWALSATSFVREVLAWMEYDVAAQEREWVASEHMCPICMEGRLGSRCVRVPTCGHTFCHTCAISHVQTVLDSSKARDITCPDADCRAGLGLSDVQALCGARAVRLFLRFQRVHAVEAFREMYGTVCPRAACGGPAIIETTEYDADTRVVTRWGSSRLVPAVGGGKRRFGRCAKCDHAFCVECQQGWHGMACEVMCHSDDEVRLHAARLHLAGDEQAAFLTALLQPVVVEPVRSTIRAWQDWGTDAMMEEMERSLLSTDSGRLGVTKEVTRETVESMIATSMCKHGKKGDEERMAEVYDEVVWITTHTRACPHCRTRIERPHGCNHMMCSACRTLFCWACGKQRPLGYHACRVFGGANDVTLAEVADAITAIVTEGEVVGGKGRKGGKS